MKKSREGKIIDIAKAVGVSTATVSRVFSRHPYVSDSIREKVLKVAKTLNYAPHISSSRYIFGILSESESGFSFGSYMNQIAGSTSKQLFDEGYNVQIFSPRQLPYIHRHTFRGVVLMTPAYAKQMQSLGIPTVIVNHFAEGVASIVTDHRQSLELAVSHLAKKGHKRIAFLRCCNQNWGSEQREIGYRSAMKEHGLPVDERLISGFLQQTEIPVAISVLMKQSPTALIVEGEDNCAMVNYALYLLSKKVPDDISIITFESCISAYMTPPQTTILQDFNALGALAAKTIIQLAATTGKRDSVSPVQTLGNKLIERQSVRNI